ncbi:hypothetical protein D1007_52309 [Hordeum vulgare]|nr:hypothetical protein D1007_52309 [Hordeum vulgare]
MAEVSPLASVPPTPVVAPIASVVARGHSPLRNNSPHANTQRSKDNLMPPSSPISVLPCTARSMRGSGTPSPKSAAACMALAICSPVGLVRTLAEMSPVRLPGFEESSEP